MHVLLHISQSAFFTGDTQPPDKSAESKPPVPDRRTETKPPVPDRRTETKPPVPDKRTEIKPPVPDRRTETKPPVPDKRTETKPPVPDRRTETKPPVPDNGSPPSTTYTPTIDVSAPQITLTSDSVTAVRQNGLVAKDEPVVTNEVNGTDPEHET